MMGRQQFVGRHYLMGWHDLKWAEESEVPRQELEVHRKDDDDDGRFPSDLNPPPRKIHIKESQIATPPPLILPPQPRLKDEKRNEIVISLNLLDWKMKLRQLFNNFFAQSEIIIGDGSPFLQISFDRLRNILWEREKELPYWFFQSSITNSKGNPSYRICPNIQSWIRISKGKSILYSYYGNKAVEVD